MNVSTNRTKYVIKQELIRNENKNTWSTRTYP